MLNDEKFKLEQDLQHKTMECSDLESKIAQLQAENQKLQQHSRKNEEGMDNGIVTL